jgi:TonB family protein
MTAMAYRVYELPWARNAEDERRFRRIVRNVMLALLVFGIVLPWLPLPETLDDVPPEVPQRYAKLMLEKKPPPPPPVPKAEPKPEPLVEAEPEPVKQVRTDPVPEPEAMPEAARPEQVQKARETASKAGVMAFADALADLRENTAVASVTTNASLTAGAGASSANERSVITSRAGAGSGGINTAALSRNTGGSGLAGRSTTRVASTIGGDGAARAAEGGRSGGGVASRSREEIELVFDKNKGAIFALYKRALRADPTLQGKLVLSLTIAPSGEVTDCDVVSSELSDPAFERKLIARVMMFRFEAKDVATVTTTKPIDFFPA